MESGKQYHYDLKQYRTVDLSLGPNVSGRIMKFGNRIGIAFGGYNWELMNGQHIEIGRNDLGGESTVSLKHVRIEYVHGVVMIEDFGSTNGTTVNYFR